MPLTPGTQLRPYEVVSAIGAGSMGEVYRARGDTRLDRDIDIAHESEKAARGRPVFTT